MIEGFEHKLYGLRLDCVKRAGEDLVEMLPRRCFTHAPPDLVFLSSAASS
jgi:hypothetical protein